MVVEYVHVLRYKMQSPAIVICLPYRVVMVETMRKLYSLIKLQVRQITDLPCALL